jgi:hypothetical protein
MPKRSAWLARTTDSVMPGVGFGEYGEGSLRFSLTGATENIKKVCDRIARIRT